MHDTRPGGSGGQPASSHGHGPSSTHSDRAGRAARSQGHAAVGSFSSPHGGRYSPPAALKSHGSNGEPAAAVPLPTTSAHARGTRNGGAAVGAATPVFSQSSRLTWQHVARSASV